MSLALVLPPLSPAWKRVEDHYGTACRFGRQAVEEAWRCGDALIAAKAETKHGDWIPALKAAGIGERTAQDLMRLRQTYAEIRKLRVFDSVHAALPSGKPDTLSDFDTMLDPDPLFEQVDIFRKFSFDMRTDEALTYEERLAYACWSIEDGMELRRRVESKVDAYTDALCDFCESYREGRDSAKDEAVTADVLHMSVLTGMQRFYKEAAAAVAAGGPDGSLP